VLLILARRKRRGIKPQGRINNGSLITADHHEMELVEMAEKINVTWFR
jgi:hypothetical protein